MARKIVRKIIKKKSNKNPLLVAILVLLIILIMVMASWFFYFLIPENINFKWGDNNKNSKTREFKDVAFTIKEPLIDSVYSQIYLPAVDEEDVGVMTLLVVERIPGSGRTMVDIDTLFFWADTQQSIRTAKDVAIDVSGINADKYNLVYNIYAEAEVIGGESAGAAMTIATIAVLQNKTLNENVIITGTIDSDGIIGPVGSVLAKAIAAKEIGATIFLVPRYQGEEIIYETKETCEQIGPAEFCTTEQIPKKVSIGQEANITVIEVRTIEDTLGYFFQEN